MRKLVIAEAMFGKLVICVTGLQGTGKTTMIKNFFELEERNFAIDASVGEKLPVFITEGEVKMPVLYSVKLIKNERGIYEIKEDTVSSEKFVEEAYVDQGISDTMYLKMIVPVKHRMGKTVFALLPGFEKNNDYWQTIIEFSVHCSDSAIFTLTDTNRRQKMEDNNNKRTQKRRKLIKAVGIISFFAAAGYLLLQLTFESE